MSHRTRVLAAAFLVVGCGRAQPSAADLAARRTALDSLERFTARSYANFDWKVRRGEVDPVALHRRTDSLLRSARTDRAVTAALRDFVAAFRDGHFVAAAGSGSASRTEDGWPSRSASAADVCDAFGWGSERSRTAFAKLGGWRAQPLPQLPFAAGHVQRGGRRYAVLRIAAFGYEPHGWACRAAWPEVQRETSGSECAATCEARLRHAAADSIAAALGDAVRVLTRERPDAVIIDLTGNGGGTEWVSKAVRVITPATIPAQPVGYIRNAAHRAALARTLARVDSALPTLVPGAWRDTVVAARARIEGAIRVAETPCVRDAVWRSGVDSLACDGLITGLWTTGAIAALPPGFAPSDALASELYSLARLPAPRGAWAGRLVLVIDHATASATEQFVAELADGAGALVVGERSYGSGCGYTRRTERLELRAYGLIIRAPDCARFRRDGTNEVAGIAPTHEVGWAKGDGAGERMEKVVRWLGSLP